MGLFNFASDSKLDLPHSISIIFTTKIFVVRPFRVVHEAKASHYIFERPGYCWLPPFCLIPIHWNSAPAWLSLLRLSLKLSAPFRADFIAPNKRVRLRVLSLFTVSMGRRFTWVGRQVLEEGP